MSYMIEWRFSSLMPFRELNENKYSHQENSLFYFLDKTFTVSVHKLINSPVPFSFQWSEGKVQWEAPRKPSVQPMALLDAELVAHLVECSQVSLLVHHRRPTRRGRESEQEQRAPAEPGTAYSKLRPSTSSFLTASTSVLNFLHKRA